MEATIYNSKGKEAGNIKLSEKLFGQKWNADLVHQVVTSMRSNLRTGTADTKGRGEVAGGGKKPWKQKGTGRARHGSTRSPIWVGGGVTHGPLAEKNYKKKVNKKMSAKAMAVLLSEKYKKGEVLFVENFGMTAMKTKNAAEVVKSFASIKGFEKLSRRSKNTIYIITGEREKNAEKSFANLPAVSMDTANHLNALELAMHKYIIISDPATSLATLEAKLA
jgi:large subunit ribosomal protein L4